MARRLGPVEHGQRRRHAARLGLGTLHPRASRSASTRCTTSLQKRMQAGVEPRDAVERTVRNAGDLLSHSWYRTAPRSPPCSTSSTSPPATSPTGRPNRVPGWACWERGCYPCLWSGWASCESTRVPAPIKRVVHFGSRSVGRLTASARVLPDVPDLRRSALRHHLALPRARRASGGAQSRTAQGRSLLRHQLSPQLRLVQGTLPVAAPALPGSNAIWASRRAPSNPAPTTSTTRTPVARIARDLPDVKVIVLVRDPIERAYLAARPRAGPRLRDRAGLRPRPPAGTGSPCATTGTPAGRPGVLRFAHQHHGYRARGEYATYLDDLAQHIDRSRILVVESERFFTDPKPVYDTVLDFLGLPLLGYPHFERHNARPRRDGSTPSYAPT